MTLIARRLLALSGSILLTFSVRRPSPNSPPLSPHRHLHRQYGHLRPPRRRLLPFANGGFIARTKLPADRAAIGVFTVSPTSASSAPPASSRTPPRPTPPPASDQRKIADLYHSYMDEAAIESHGLAPLKPHLDEIAAINTPARTRPRPRPHPPRRRRRPQQHQLPHRRTSSASGSRPASTTPITTPPTCCKAASSSPIATTTSRLRHA